MDDALCEWYAGYMTMYVLYVHVQENSTGSELRFENLEEREICKRLQTYLHVELPFLKMLRLILNLFASNFLPSFALAQNFTSTLPAQLPIFTNTSLSVPAGSQNYSGNIAPIPWSTRPEVYDHNGLAVRHGRARLNDIRMHYCTYK